MNVRFWQKADRLECHEVCFVPVAEVRFKGKLISSFEDL